MNILFMILLAVSPFQIEEVEVVAERSQVPSESFRIIAEVSHDEIASLPVANLADILAYLPGIDVRSRGASDAQSDISLRGGTFDQVLIMLNGVRLGDAQTGHYAMHLPVSPSLIERIEVLQTPTASLCGALCGAINIITRQTPDDRYAIQLSGGTNGDISPLFAASVKRGEVHINTSGRYARSSGYYAPEANEKETDALNSTGYQLADLYMQTRWRGLDVQAGAQYKDAGLGTGYGYASTDQFDATRTLIASARYHGAVSGQWSLTALAAYRANYDRYEWHRRTDTPNRHWTHSAQTSLYAHYRSSVGRTSFGASIDFQALRSSSMGTHERLQADLSAEQQFLWRNFSLTLGATGHYNTRFGWYGSGLAQFGYSFASTGAVYIGATRSLRMPTWTDLYYKAGVQRGNEYLKAEKASTLMLGGRFNRNWTNAGSLHLSGELFYRWGQDIIDWTYREAEGLYYATNQNTVDALGLDITVQYRLNAWLRNLSVRYAYTRLSLDVAQTKSNYLDYLKHKITVNIDHGIYVWSKGRIGGNWSIRWQQREGTYVDINGTPDHPYKPVLLLDGSIYVEYAHMRVAIESTNMTNRHYYDYGGVLQPGVHGQINLSYMF